MARGGELASVVVHPVQTLDVVDDFPRFAGPEQRDWKAHGMKRHVVLSHELDVANVAGALVFAPPAFPIAVVPFHRGADVFDGSIEPDVENLSFETGTDLALVSDRDSPFQIAGDAAILQSFIEPLARNRRNEHRPVFPRIDPLAQSADHLRLLQEEVFRIAQFDVGRTGNGGARVDQVGWIENAGAVFALIAPGAFVPAMPAGADHVA